MGQNDPDERIAELERQVAEQKHMMERLLAEQAVADAGHAGVAQPTAPPIPGLPPPPLAPQSGQGTGWTPTWGSADDDHFSRRIAELKRLEAAANLAAYQVDVPGAAGFGGQAGLGRVSGTTRIAIAAILIAVGVPLVLIVSFFVAMVSLVAPSTVDWMSGSLCNSGYHLASTHTPGYNGRFSFICVNGDSDSNYDVSTVTILGYQTLAVAPVVLVVVCIAVVVFWRIRRKRS